MPMIEGYVGRRGSGKTYTLTARVLKIAQRYAVVAANYRIKVPNFVAIEGPEDLVGDGLVPRLQSAIALSGLYAALGGLAGQEVSWWTGRKKPWHAPPQRILLVLDEIHLYFESRQSHRLPMSLSAVMSQTRKLRWDLLWSVQHEARVDKIVKSNTDWMWHCHRWFQGWRVSGAPLFFTARSYEPEFFRKKKERNIGVLRWYRRAVQDAYDTYETIEVASHLKAVKDHYLDPQRAS